MKRRSFLKTGTIFSAPLFLKGLPVLAADVIENQALNVMARAASECGKALVIIQLKGGNDGLNTVLPLDQWGNLYTARSNILMDESAVLRLNNNITTGLHPAMTGMKNLYDEGKLMIVQGVSYPNPNFSHFRATDIWLTASNSDVVLDSGWLGRALDTLYPGFPNGYPNAGMPDPLAIQIGSTLPFSLQGPNMNMGYSTSDPNSLMNVINGIADPAPENDYGFELTFLRLMKDQSNAYTSSIQTAYNRPQSQSATYPAGNPLGDQLRMVARLINGGLKTPIYVVNHPRTFDTHEYQVEGTDKLQGSHAVNLKMLSDAITAFQEDLRLMGKEELVTGMTFSEFGRRIKSNASSGTDHGVGAPVFFFGAALNTSLSAANPVPGMLGTSPVIPANATVNDQVAMQFDFRQVYTTIMQDWLCMTKSEADAVLGGSFERLAIFSAASILPIELLSFSGQAQGTVSLLQWATASEKDNYKFEIERSRDAINFTSIGEVPGAGDSNIEINYTYTDAVPYQGINYYRLKQVDYNGTKEYSPIISIYFESGTSVTVYPNPAYDHVTISLVDVKEEVYAQVFNSFGQLLIERRLDSGTHQNRLDISTLPNGNYFMRIQGSQTILTKQFIKQ